MAVLIKFKIILPLKNKFEEDEVSVFQSFWTVFSNKKKKKFFSKNFSLHKSEILIKASNFTFYEKIQKSRISYRHTKFMDILKNNLKFRICLASTVSINFQNFLKRENYLNFTNTFNSCKEKHFWKNFFLTEKLHVKTKNLFPNIL